MNTIFVTDETLKLLALEQTVPLLFREKAALAAGISQNGADAVVLPPVKNPREDAVIIKTIASVVRDACLCLPAGMEPESVRTAAQCLAAAALPCLQVEMPLSAVQLEYKLGMKEEQALDKLALLVKEARACCDAVEFIARDSTDARRSFLIAACRTAEESGASAITLYDDAGTFTPAETAQLVREVIGAVSVPVRYRASNSIGLGAANVLAALEAGASGVTISLAGKDALTAAQFAAVFFAKAPAMGLTSHLKETSVKSTAEQLLASLSRSSAVSAASPVTDIFLDSSSSPADISAAVSSLGYELSDADLGRVTDALRAICRKKSSIGAKELEAVIASSAMQVPSAYHLGSYLISTGSGTASMASIHLVREEETLSGVSTGDGPIDSAFRAIEQCLGTHYELDDFQIQAVTEGRESLGSALVCLRSGGKRYSGTGLSPDIVGASIRAYINALNKIVYEEGRA